MNKQLQSRHLELLPEGREFYRLEFELCDLDKSESLNVTEIGVCQEKQAKIIHDRLPFTNAKFPTRIDLQIA